MSELPHKRSSVAWGWWMTLGWMGAHRFYLEERGALMMAWFVVGLIVAAALEGTGTVPAATAFWFGSVLLWWSIDALLIPRWTRELQVAYADVAQQLEAESMVEVLTLPLMRAAQKHGGKLTVTEGVLATGLTITQIEATLMEMAKTGYVLPEYDEDEAMREAELEARELAVEEAAMMVEEEREQAVRGQRSAALKGGLAAGVAAVGVRALMGGLLGDDE